MNTRKVANPKTSWSILPRWVKNWEDFAGKEYARVQPAGQTIGDTIRQAQELLCSLQWTKFIRANREAWKEVFPTVGSWYHLNDPETDEILWTAIEKPGITMPKSLGELCLEEYQNKIMKPPMIYVMLVGANAREGLCRTYEKEAQDLRRLLYHRRGHKEGLNP